MVKRIWLPVLLLAGLLIGCEDDGGTVVRHEQQPLAPVTVEAEATTVRTTETARVHPTATVQVAERVDPTRTVQATHTVEPEPIPTVQVASTVEPESTPTPDNTRRTTGLSLAHLYYDGVASKEEVILGSDTIARVELLGVSTSTAAYHVWWLSGWSGNLEFRFRVLEYLKGSGPTEIVAVAANGPYKTEADARKYMSYTVAWHDTRWDDREAIVFLSSTSDIVPDLGSRYFLGDMSLGGENAYLVSSRHSKKWLPEATQPGGSGRSDTSSGDKLFLLDAPAPEGGSGRRSSGSATGPTIRLSAMKTLIADLDTQAGAGGTDEYRECVRLAYVMERWTHEIDVQGNHPSLQHHSLSSGLPAGTLFHEFENGSGLPPDNVGRTWAEGDAKDLVKFEASDLTPHTSLSTLYGPKQRLYFTQRVLTARPLPAGVYRFYLNTLAAWRVVCNLISDVERNRFEHQLTVTTPPGSRVVHEAFFDPVAIGTAVGAVGSDGVLSPSTAVVGLKWESGTVTMEIDPSTTVKGHAVDLVALDGSVTTTLAFDDATHSGGTLTWSVATQPWSDGDLLMLRIHKPISNDATLSGLTLSGVDLTFSTATTTYTASVPATTTQTTVTPTTNHDSATYVVKLGGVVDDDGTIPLAAGDNVITIDVTAEDGSSTQTYTVTVTRATPSEPITVTLTPRVEGSETYVNITIEWNDPQPCDGQYMVALYSTSDYLVTFMGFHPAPATTSLSRETYLWWDLRFFPDRWAGVSCDPSDYSGRRELGRVSLRAAHPDNN